jgi:hypothetical protein
MIYMLLIKIFITIKILKNKLKMNLAEYSLRESVSAQGREGRGFDSDPGRNKKI